MECRYFRDGGGYYIDVGCSRLIADGKIKIKQGVEVERLTAKGVLFADGTEVEADMIGSSSFPHYVFLPSLTPPSLAVMATGYSSSSFSSLSFPLLSLTISPPPTASQRETVARLVGDDVAQRLGSVWGADAQGEIPGVCALFLLFLLPSSLLYRR
jgi:hypothetical protein